MNRCQYKLKQYNICVLMTVLYYCHLVKYLYCVPMHPFGTEALPVQPLLHSQLKFPGLFSQVSQQTYRSGKSHSLISVAKQGKQLELRSTKGYLQTLLEIFFFPCWCLIFSRVFFGYTQRNSHFPVDISVSSIVDLCRRAGIIILKIDYLLYLGIHHEHMDFLDNHQRIGRYIHHGQHGKMMSYFCSSCWYCGIRGRSYLLDKQNC